MFLQNFAMLLSCRGVDWERFYFPLEEMFPVVTLAQRTVCRP